MKKYNRVMLGRSSCFYEQCKNEGYIGANFSINEDLTKHLPDNWKEFNKKYIPVFLKNNPDKTKVSAGLGCGALWTICKGLEIGDIVLSPNGSGEYLVGEIIGNYYYVQGTDLPHRRKVQWYEKTIARAEMSDELRHSTGSIGTCCDITSYKDEIESFLNKVAPVKVIATSTEVEDASEFALEKHLEDFLVKNWKQTELGKKFDIYEEDGELVGQQYNTDTGPIDVLAISKNKKTILVVELKKGRTSDVVIGQVQRYMGYVKEELLEPGQEVRGLIIGLSADTRLRRALSVCPNIDFYRYQIDFKLVKE